MYIAIAMSSTEQFLILAISRHTYPKNKGEFILPLNGTGAKKGLSVSIKRSLAFNLLATILKGSAFLKVILPEKKL